MNSFYGLLHTAMLCMTALGLAFMVVLSMPKSRMRDVVANVLLAGICFLYVISPVDLMPEMFFGPLGLVDDAAAVVVGLIAAHKATRLGA